MNPIEVEITEEEFMEQLNDIFGDIKVCGYHYPAGKLLKEIDPIAFDTEMSAMPTKYKCSECDTEYDEYDEAEECCQDEEE